MATITTAEREKPVNLVQVIYKENLPIFTAWELGVKELHGRTDFATVIPINGQMVEIGPGNVDSIGGDLRRFQVKDINWDEVALPAIVVDFLRQDGGNNLDVYPQLKRTPIGEVRFEEQALLLQLPTRGLELRMGSFYTDNGGMSEFFGMNSATDYRIELQVLDWGRITKTTKVKGDWDETRKKKD